MKKIVVSLAMAVLALVGVAATAAPASATVQLESGWKIWTKEYCESGKFVHMRRLHFGSDTQGREYVYRRNGRLCTFVVDHMPGSHHISVVARTGTRWAQDEGTYAQYAGALAGPTGRCINVLPSVWIGANNKSYGAPWKRYC